MPFNLTSVFIGEMALFLAAFFAWGYAAFLLRRIYFRQRGLHSREELTVTEVAAVNRETDEWRATVKLL